MKECGEQVAVLSNLHAPDRIGFKVSFSKGDGEKLRDSARAQWEDALASVAWRLLRSFLKHRLGSMMWYVLGPGCSAGLLHDDPERVQMSLAFMKSAAVALSRAASIDSPLTKKMCDGQALTTPLMQWVCKALGQDGFANVGGV